MAYKYCLALTFLVAAASTTPIDSNDKQEEVIAVSPADFAFQPVSNSCTQFTMGGQNFRCPFGLIFAPQFQVCVYPDTVNVPHCSAQELFSVSCPNPAANRFYGNNYGSDYGNYYGYQNPSITYATDYGTFLDTYGNYGSYPYNDYVIDIYWKRDGSLKPGCCQYYFICMPNGQPRLLGCPKGQVFNTRTYKCDDPSNVMECRV